MKKILTTISALLISITFLIPQTAFAVACSDTTPCTQQGQMCIGGQCKVLEDELLPRPGELDGSTSGELQVIGDLPEVGYEQLGKTIIKTILGWSMLLTLIGLVVASIYYLTSLGKEEDITKAKNIIIYLIVGMAIMAASYAIITGIAQFEFFNAAPAP